MSNANLLSCNQSEGIYRQNQINTSINIRTPKGMNIGGYYSANWANSNDAQMSDPFSSSVDYGRARFGVRSRLTLFGSFPLPFKISASPMLTAQSGSPYNITVGIPDPVTLGGSDRPSWAGSGPMPAYGSWAQCINAANFSTTSGLNLTSGTNTEIPLNFCTGPANVSLSLRLSRAFGFGPKTAAELSAEQQARQAARRRAGRAGRAGTDRRWAGGGGGGRGGGGGFGGGGGGGGRGGGGGGFGGGRGTSTGRKYNLTLGAYAQNLFNEVPDTQVRSAA